jgi:hypothetical protein
VRKVQAEIEELERALNHETRRSSG